MANFALIKENIVIAVIVVDNEILLSNGVEVEQLGIDFIDSLNIKSIYDYDTIRQTSYNSKFRNTYAGIGFTYDSVNNVFIAPKPFEDWTLVDFKWTAPIPYPNDGNHYIWKDGDWEEIITGALN
jgi:hypothetical protein